MECPLWRASSLFCLENKHSNIFVFLSAGRVLWTPVILAGPQMNLASDRNIRLMRLKNQIQHQNFAEFFVCHFSITWLVQ
jgi:hypothetical protein